MKIASLNEILSLDDSTVWFFPNEEKVRKNCNYICNYSRKGKNVKMPMFFHLTTIKIGKKKADYYIIRGKELVNSIQYRRHDVDKDILLEFTLAPKGYLKDVCLSKVAITN